MNKKYSVPIEPKEIITETTNALIPYYTNTAHLHCKMMGIHGYITVDKSSLDIMKGSCLFYGGDFKGNLHSSQQILEGQKILPIILSIEFDYCMIPISSPMKKDCVWVAFHHIERVYAKGKNSIIVFKNQDKLEVNITKKSLESRLNKAARILMTYHFRWKLLKELRRRNLYIAEDREGYGDT